MSLLVGAAILLLVIYIAFTTGVLIILLLREDRPRYLYRVGELEIGADTLWELEQMAKGLTPDRNVDPSDTK